MLRYSLPTDSIDGISLYVGGIEVHLYYLVPHIGKEHFNVLRSVLCMEKSVVGQIIIFIKSMMSRKRGLVTAIPSLRHNQVMSKTLNIRLLSMKMLTIIKT